MENNNSNEPSIQNFFKKGGVEITSKGVKTQAITIDTNLNKLVNKGSIVLQDIREKLSKVALKASIKARRVYKDSLTKSVDTSLVSFVIHSLDGSSVEVYHITEDSKLQCMNSLLNRITYDVAEKLSIAPVHFSNLSYQITPLTEGNVSIINSIYTNLTEGTIISTDSFVCKINGSLDSFIQLTE